jgi:EAL domain-containing protein (putative c-di-GMP-specific phosphodiesterase class I)
VVATIVDFAQRMGMKTIAEYIENEAVFTKVKQIGIDYSQGYYCGKPRIIEIAS